MSYAGNFVALSRKQRNPGVEHQALNTVTCQDQIFLR